MTPIANRDSGPVVSAPHATPASLVISTYAWWLLIGLQATFLAYVALTLAEADRIGDTAYDIVLVLALPTLAALAPMVTETAGVIMLRRGRSGARTLLTVAGCTSVLAAALSWGGTWVQAVNTADPSFTAYIALILLTGVLAVVAIVAMFWPSAGRYLLRDQPPVAPPELEAEAEAAPELEAASEATARPAEVDHPYDERSSSG